jgi:Holliday junction resolvase RusA-like endonuclease
VKVQRVVAGIPRGRLVDCQECGQVKELGVACAACRWPQVEVVPAADGRFVVMLPLCPSTNERMRPVRMGRFSRDILTDDARDYIASVATELGPIIERAKAFGFKPIEQLTSVEVWMVLPRRSCDPTNYEKCMWDALERSGFAKNDRYIMPHFRGVAFNTQATGVAVKA